MLSEFFSGKKLIKLTNSDEMNAHGAAIQAAILSGEGQELLKDVLTLDLYPHSLGIDAGDGVMDIVVPRNTTLPTKKQKNLSIKQIQSTMNFKVFEGERGLTKDNNFIRSLNIEGF